MQIFVKKTGTTGSTVPLSVDEDATVEDLFKLVSQEISPDGDYSLIFNTKNLDGFRGQRLAECNVKNKATMLLIYRVHGGRNPEQQEALEAAMNMQKSGLTPLLGFVTLTQEECMITLDSPGPGENNAKMFCGHVISPQGMTAHALSLVQEGRYQFYCPTCQKDWPFNVVEHVGSFTDLEKKNVQSKLAENFAEKAMGVQNCPKCKSYCQRKNTSVICVVCPVCTKKNGSSYEFCWSCLHEWCGRNRQACGNPDCDGQDSRNRYLRECGEVEIQFTKIKCPAVRACPSCGVLINHVKGCKQMTCSQCKNDFCFVCLKQAQGGNWKCGSYNTKCEKAPIQQF